MANKEMDVVKPGKSAPDSTARPVIVGHKPILQQDPMVNGDSASGLEKEDKTAEEKVVVHAAKVIEPLKEEAKPEIVTAEPAEPKPADTPAPEAEPDEPAAEPEKDEKPAVEEPASDDSAVVDAVAEQAGSKKKKDDELSEEEKKKQEAIQKLIEEKKYFVPINVASRKRNNRISVVILILLLLLVAGYVVLDMGLVDLGISLPIDLIKN